MPTEDSVTNEPPEEVGWSHHAQDVAEAEEAARYAADPPPPDVMRRSMPLGRFLLVLIGLCIAVGAVIYFIFDH